MMKNIEKKVFPDQEAFERKYEEYLNLDTMAPRGIMEAYGEIGDAIEKYIERLSEWEFRIMYVMGYMDALKDNNIKGGTL